MTMQDLITRLKDRPKAGDEHLEEEQREWRRALDQLFAEIERWVAPAVGAGVLTTRRSEIEVTEQDYGSYMAPVLEIRDGRLTVRLAPVGGRVAGVVVSGGERHLGLRGRVDLVCGPIKVPLVRTSSGAWRALPLRGQPRDLTESTFAEILGEVLLDE